MTISTRPVALPESIRYGLENVAPASSEKITFTSPSPLLTVNQTTASASSKASTDGPFTGQPAIFQLSSPNVVGLVHAPLTYLTIEISRTSSSLLSRYTTTGPLVVIAALVWQQSHTRLSSSVRCAISPVAGTTALRNVMAPPIPWLS